MPGRLRVAGGGRVARVRHGDHDVGVDGRLAPEDLAHLAARHLRAVALEQRVGAREVDVLEDAERAPLALDDLPGLDPALRQRDHLARLDVAQEARADDVERAALRGDAVAVADLAERERPQAGAVAERDDGVVRHHDGREGALEPRHHVLERVLERVRLVRREHRGDQLRVRGGAEGDAALRELLVQLERVDQVAVVGERDLAAVGAVDRLGVLPRRRAGRRVAHVADGHRAGERAQLRLVEDLRDEAEVAQGHDVAVLARGDPGRLLAAVLERVQREVGEAGDVGLRGVHPEDATLVARSVAIGNRLLRSHSNRLGRDPSWASCAAATGTESVATPAVMSTRSPPVSPITRKPCGCRDSSSALDGVARAREEDPAGSLAEQREAVLELDRRADAAADRALGERAREAALRDVVRRRDRARAHGRREPRRAPRRARPGRAAAARSTSRPCSFSSSEPGERRRERPDQRDRVAGLAERAPRAPSPGRAACRPSRRPASGRSGPPPPSL